MATTTFYSQIGANRRNSVLLSLAVVLLLGLLGFAIGGAISGTWQSAAVAAGIALILGFGAALLTYYSGDQLVLASSGAREVNAQDAPQLVNVVSEIAIAANIPVPRIYIIDDTAPNAFATGRDPQHASVAITKGLFQKLDREELQGVMAHELSHVRNYDIRFSLMVGVLVGSVALLADMFLRVTFWGGMGGRRSRSSSDSGGSGGLQAILMIAALILAILAPIAAKLVQLAVSRQREYMADASGVELTRNPYGLERALAKIALDTEPLEVANRATQHLYFENPVKAATADSSNLFSTHPPVLDRINRLRALTGEAPVDAPTLVLNDHAPAVAPPAATAPTGGRVTPPPPPRRPRGRGRGWADCAGRPRWTLLRGPWYSAPRRRAPAGTRVRAEIAQLVEHATENRGVASSNLALGTNHPVGTERKWLSW